MEWNIKLKRVYDDAEETDGLRILVDRMWPRGIKKSDLKYDIWAKDVTPSTLLRRYFHEDPSAHWEKFAADYRQELMTHDALGQLAGQIRESGATTVTLLFGFRNKTVNHAVVLRDALLQKLSEG
jgi:uncharacterized protein YeaO (DUF488 family)